VTPLNLFYDSAKKTKEKEVQENTYLNGKLIIFSVDLNVEFNIIIVKKCKPECIQQNVDRLIVINTKRR